MNKRIPFRWRKGLVLSATFLFGLFLTVSCKKKINEIGQNSIDQNELLNSGAIDTFSLNTYSYFDDSVISDNATFGVLGSYVDPIFGKYESSIYTQFRLQGENPDFGDVSTISIDSFVLALEYIGFYGEEGVQNVDVFEITEALSLDSTYYAFSTVTTGPTSLTAVGGPVAIDLRPSGITVVGNDTIDTQMRIHLDTNIAKTMMNDASLSGVMLDNETFLDYFKGVHIKVDNPTQNVNEGGVFYFNMNDIASKMTIYYTQDTLQKTWDFLINTNCADFNHVEVNTDMTGVAPDAINDTVMGPEQFYAQAFGSRAVVEIPGLSNIPQNSIIHKAILVLPVSYHTGNPYSPGLDISIATTLEKGATQLFSINTVGTYDNFTKSVEVDLRGYVQAIVNKELANTQLVFSPILHNTSADRIVFNGSQTTFKAKPKLYILYTEF